MLTCTRQQLIAAIYKACFYPVTSPALFPNTMRLRYSAVKSAAGPEGRQHSFPTVLDLRVSDTILTRTGWPVLQ